MHYNDEKRKKKNSFSIEDSAKIICWIFSCMYFIYSRKFNFLFTIYLGRDVRSSFLLIFWTVHTITKWVVLYEKNQQKNIYTKIISLDAYRKMIKLRELLWNRKLTLSFRWWKIKWTKSSSMCTIVELYWNRTRNFERNLYVAAAVVWELEKVTNRLYEKRRVCVFALCTFFWKSLCT